MYIALISAHALGLSGVHFFTCIKAQWNGKKKNQIWIHFPLNMIIKHNIREIYVWIDVHLFT